MTNLPWWLQRRPVRIIWASLITVVMGAAVGVVIYRWLELERAALDRASLFARVVADHADRSLQTTETTLRSLTQIVSDEAADADPVHVGLRLSRAVGGLPFVRSLSMVDSQRRVLASSEGRNLGVLLGPEYRLTDETPEVLIWSAPRGARDLVDPASADGLDNGYVPVAVSFGGRDGQVYYLMATLNLPYFRNQHELLLGGAPLKATLTNYQGIVLAHSHEGPVKTGVSVVRTRVFRDHLPSFEAGSFISDGLDGSRVVSAFRVARRYPLVAIVEQSHAGLMQDLRGITLGVGGTALLFSVMMTVFGILALRSLHRHENMTTDLMQVNRALIASETRKWALMEAAIDAVVTIDEQGFILEFNAAAEKMFGYKRDLVLGQPMHAFLVPPHLRDAHVNGMAHFLKTGEGPVLNRRIEITAMRANQEIFPVELTIVPAKAEGGLYFAATIRDITQRQRDEAERNELLRKYQETAIDLSMQKLAMDQHTIVVIADPAGRVIYANNKYLEVANCAADSILGRPLQEVICNGPAQGGVYQDLFELVRKGHVWHGELVNLRQDGSMFWLSSTIVPVPGDDGLPREYISVHSDVTRLEEDKLRVSSIRTRELEIGSRIQKSLLVNPPDIGNSQIWVSSSSHASQGIDGDFVDIIPMGPDCVDIIQADVMGKGVPAALMGAATKMQISRLIAVLLAERKHKDALPSPAEIVSALHREMSPHLQALEAFVTMAYVRVDSRQRQVTWVGCGHEEPLMLAASGAIHILHNQHPPIGVVEIDVCEQGALSMQPGDAVFLCSDGVTDAVMPDGKKLGADKLQATIRHLSTLHPTPGAVLHSMRREVLHPGVTLTDDATMMYVMFQNSRRQAYCRELPADLAGVTQVRQTLDTMAARAGMDAEGLGLYAVACVEAYTNIVRHAKRMPVDAPVEMVTSLLPDALEVEFVYLGEPYSPPEVNMDVDWESYPEGGLGLTIIHSACEEVQYSSEAGRNITRLRSYPSVRSNL
jgi:phosphoserine phosphatase RsbU/P